MIRYLLCAVLMAVLPPAYAISADYNFVSIKGLIEQEIGKEILSEVYAKIGIKIRITPLPGPSAQAAATSGKRDGEIMRIWDYGENNPELVRVPTPYYTLETMGFIKKGSSVSVNSREDLAKYKIARVIGVKHTINITKNIPRDQIIEMNSSEKAIMAVVRGHADVALTHTADGLMIVKKNRFTDIVPLKKPLAVLNLYNYIHKSKAEIVPKVNAILKSMKKSGELSTIITNAEKNVTNRFIK